MSRPSGFGSPSRSSAAPSLVVLAAGAGSRFGGAKQLVAVGADGAAIMDILVRRAAAAGVKRAVIVVAPDLESRVRTHLSTMGRPPISVDLAVQRLRPGRAQPLGTAAAVLAARESIGRSIDGSFVVVNGDDLYPEGAFSLLVHHLQAAPDDEHAMVAFRVARTLAGDRPVSRALVEVDGASALVSVREGAIVPGPRGLRFEIDGRSQPIRADACVSMNMWGFRATIFEPLARAVAEFVSTRRAGEVFLPDVVTAEVGAGLTVRVLVSEEACVGVTHEADLEAVREALS